MLSPDKVAVGVPDRERAGALARELGVSPVLAQLLLNRGVADAAAGRHYLEAGLDACHDPFLLRDMATAVELLERALAEAPVFVHGDYDVDGVSATVLLAEGLRRLGGQVLYHVPHRATEGYGVSLAAVERAAASGARLLLTADCGSSSREAVARARDLGMTVLVSDHHLLPEVLPEPHAFLNPNLPDCPYPDKGLCGTGIAYKILQALHRRRGLPDPEDALDLVALATIADVAPLQGENRVLARAGLARLGRLERPGLRALAEQCGMAEGECGAWSVGFLLAPRLNAAGRLDTADLAVQLLLEQDPERCRVRAAELEHLNGERQRLEKEIREAIEARLREFPERRAGGVIVEGGEGWHHGVIGITAARLVDAHGVPAFVADIEGEHARGSARAPVGVDLYAAMSRCADVFVKFGGHARAAGFTVETARLEEMRERLAAAVAEVRTETPPLAVDFELPLHRVDLALVRELRRLEPVGEGNRRPLFLASRARLEQARAVGRDGAHLSLVACQGEGRLKAIAFRQGEHLAAVGSGELCYDILYTLEEDTWNGASRPQLVIEGILAPDPVVMAVLGVAPLEGRQSGLAGSDRRLTGPSPSPDPQAVPVRAGPGAPEAGDAELPGPALVDSRSVLNRARYVKGLVSRAGRVLLVAGSEIQARRVAERLRDPRVLVATADRLPADLAAEEVVLLAPPPRLDLLQHPALGSARRLHLLFGERELGDLQVRARALDLDRERMTRIWQALVRQARDGVLAEGDLERVAPAVGGPEAVRTALSVFEELGVASWETAGAHRRLRLGRGTGRRLEESARFNELGRLRLEVQRVRRAFGQRHVSLEPEARPSGAGVGS